MRKELLIDREILHNGKYKMSQVLQYCIVFACTFRVEKVFTRVLIFLITVSDLILEHAIYFFFVKKIIYKSPHTMGNNTICVWNI